MVRNVWEACRAKTYGLSARAARGGGTAAAPGGGAAVASDVGGCGGRKKGEGERGERGEAREVHLCLRVANWTLE